MKNDLDNSIFVFILGAISTLISKNMKRNANHKNGKDSTAESTLLFHFLLFAYIKPSNN